MTLIEQTLNEIIESRNNAMEGKINCVPFCIPELRYLYPGTRKASIVGYTAESKGGKSQFMTFAEVISPLMYAYEHPDELHLHYIYFSMEETKHDIINRFISHLLFVKYNIRVSGDDLDSTNVKMPLTADVLNLIQSDTIMNMLKFFEEHIDFYDDIHHTITMNNIVKAYANSHGRKVYSDETFIGEDGVTYNKVRQYIPNDPKEYVYIITDHVGLMSPNKKQLTLFNTLEDWSNNQVDLKNTYGYVSAFAQQQVDGQVASTDAMKLGSVLATKSGLKDNKSTGNACTQLFGVNDTGKYLGRAQTRWDDYARLFPNNFRVVELILNRKGMGNLQVPMFFDGMTCYFEMLPPIDDPRIERFVKLAERIRNEDAARKRKMEELQHEEISHRISIINMSLSDKKTNKSNLFANFAKLFK